MIIIRKISSLYVIRYLNFLRRRAMSMNTRLFAYVATIGIAGATALSVRAANGTWNWFTEGYTNGLSVEAGDRLQYAQNSLQRFWQKEGIESARRDPYCDGYSFWSLLDVMSPQKGAFTGPSLFDCFLREKKGGSKASDFAVFNSPSCLLLDVSGGPGRFDSDPRPFVRYHRAFDAYFDQTNRILVAGDRIPAKFMLAHYGDQAVSRPILVTPMAESRSVASSGRSPYSVSARVARSSSSDTSDPSANAGSVPASRQTASAARR